MLIYFTYLLFQRNINMVIYSRHIISLLNGIQSNARPFDEILFSFDSTTNSTSLDYFDSKTSNNLLTWISLFFCLDGWWIQFLILRCNISTHHTTLGRMIIRVMITWHRFKRHSSHYINSIVVYFYFFSNT